MIPYVGLIDEDKPAIFLKKVNLVGRRQGHGTLLLKRETVLPLAVPLPILFKELSNIVVDGSRNPLDYVKGIHDGHGVWKVLFDVREVGIVHVGDQVFNLAALAGRKRRKVGFRDAGPPAAEQVDGIAGVKVLNHKGVATVVVSVKQYLVHRNGVGQGQAVKLNVTVENLVRMRIRHAEPFSYGRGCFHKVPVSVNDEHVGGVCRPAISVDKPERFPRLVKALRVGAPPPSLLQDDEQRVTVLENWMADGSFLTPRECIRYPHVGQKRGTSGVSTLIVLTRP